MTRLLPLAAGLLGALALLLAVGCSGDDGDDFADDVIASRNDVDASLQHMANSTTNQMLLDRLRTASENIELAADRVADSEPPDDLREEREELVQSYRALAQEVGATADALEDIISDDDTSPIEGLNFTNWERAQRALAALRE